MDTSNTPEKLEQALPELMKEVLGRLAAGEDFKAVMAETNIQARVDEAIAVIKEPEFVTNRTVHSAMVAWFWTDKRLHDSDYTSKVQDAVEVAVNEAEKRFDVQMNSDLRCQWEGIEFYDGNLAAVTAAADYVAKKLKRFKGVVPLGL